MQNNCEISTFHQPSWSIFQKKPLESRQALCSHLLGELPADPGSSVQHLADAVPLGVAGDEMSVVQEHGHLGNGKFANRFNSDGYVQHLRRYEVPVPRALQPGQLHQDADVPARSQRDAALSADNHLSLPLTISKVTQNHWPFEVCDILIVGLTANVYDFGQQLIPVRRPFCLIHVNHQLLHYLHQVLLRYLLKYWRVEAQLSHLPLCQVPLSPFKQLFDGPVSCVKKSEPSLQAPTWVTIVKGTHLFLFNVIIKAEAAQVYKTNAAESWESEFLTAT